MINIKFKSYFVAVLFLVLSKSTDAQDYTGSFYSFFGIGEISPVSSVQSRGMGFTYIGLSGVEWLNTGNPANNAVLNKYASHIFDFGFYLNSATAKDGEQKEEYRNGNLTNINYFFRFNKRWTGLLGVSEYSKVGYTVTGVKNKNAIDEVNVTLRGKGGISQFYFSNSVKVLENLDLGVRFKYLFGQIRNEEDDITAINGDTHSFTLEKNYRKLRTDFGINYRIERSKYAVVIGGIFENEGEISFSNRKVNNLIPSNSDVIIGQSEEEQSGLEQALPMKYGVGASFINEKVTLAADVEINKWGALKSPVDSKAVYEDTYRYSLGMEYIPDRSDAKLLKRVRYRLGGYTRNNYFKYEGESINIWGVTTGVSLPFKSGGFLSLNYNYRNLRGTSSNLITESRNQITLDLTIKDRWFVRPKYN